MNVQEFYAEIGEDYFEIFNRIGKDEFIVKYLRKFLTDNYFGMLEKAIKEQNWQEGFAMAHNMKGLALNLGLSSLKDVSSVLCEALRGGTPNVDVDSMFSDVEAVYMRIADKIALID